MSYLGGLLLDAPDGRGPLAADDRLMEDPMFTLAEEIARGRECLARGRPLEFSDEQEAGRCWAERARARLELEQETGRRSARRAAVF